MFGFGCGRDCGGFEEEEQKLPSLGRKGRARDRLGLISADFVSDSVQEKNLLGHVKAKMQETHLMNRFRDVKRRGTVKALRQFGEALGAVTEYSMFLGLGESAQKKASDLMNRELEEEEMTPLLDALKKSFHHLPDSMNAASVVRTDISQLNMLRSVESLTRADNIVDVSTSLKTVLSNFLSIAEDLNSNLAGKPRGMNSNIPSQGQHHLMNAGLSARM